MLSNRLLEIAKMIEKSMVVADIGCDHAFLPVYLVQNQIVDKAYAIDNKEGPIAQAEKSIREAGLEEKVIPLLSDGLKNLPPEVNTVVLAGMGAELMVAIFENSPETFQSCEHIFLQPNTDVYLVRKYMSEHGFRIAKETVVFEGHYYTTMHFVQGKTEYSEKQLWLGPLLMERKDEVYLAQLKKRYDKLNHISLTFAPIKDTVEYQILTEFLK